ncbi:MAG: integrase [Clostridia bacterium]|nr:integrase [Clostridia bacterium]
MNQSEQLKTVDGASLSASATNAPALAEGDEILELEDFNFDDFQVVRREFFAHMREPSITFSDFKFQVNMACLAKFPQFDFAQVLVNQKDKILALRPCEEGAKDAYLWVNPSKGKRKPRPITCKPFFAKIVSMMEWNPKYRYKLLGRLMHSNGEYLIVFDLNAPEMYERTFVEGQKPKTSRTPVFPSEWQTQFGLPYNVHKQSMQINIFDGYAVYAIKDTTAVKEEAPVVLPAPVSTEGE